MSKIYIHTVSRITYVALCVCVYVYMSTNVHIFLFCYIFLLFFSLFGIQIMYMTIFALKMCQNPYIYDVYIIIYTKYAIAFKRNTCDIILFRDFVVCTNVRMYRYSFKSYTDLSCQLVFVFYTFLSFFFRFDLCFIYYCI